MRVFEDRLRVLGQLLAWTNFFSGKPHHEATSNYENLTIDEKHFLRLIARDQQNPNGWALCHKTLFPLVQKMPTELVELHPTEEGRGRSANRAWAVSIDAMEWL